MERESEYWPFFDVNDLKGIGESERWNEEIWNLYEK